MNVPSGLTLTVPWAGVLFAVTVTAPPESGSDAWLSRLSVEVTAGPDGVVPTASVVFPIAL